MGNRILTTAVLLVLLIFTFSCKDLFEDEAFTLTREDYTGCQIRTDGYYYGYYKQDSGLISITIFYRNGVVIDGIGGYYSLLEFEKMFLDGTFYSRNKDYKDTWGIFKVTNNVVMIERVIAGGGLRRNAFIDYGEILNDTTIHIYQNKSSYVSAISVKDDTLYFKQFSPKPDSTNVFIK